VLFYPLFKEASEDCVRPMNSWLPRKFELVLLLTLKEQFNWRLIVFV
jgi:hypothetical protein